MISQTEENYLKALLALTSLRGETSINEISKHLDLKMPTVNSMIKRLAEKNLVLYESYKPLKLTEKGKKEAALIIRKHRLTELFLVEKMGFARDEVHNIAEQIEHIQSTEFFARMDKLLGYPKIDPHGSPIPDAEGNIAADHYLPIRNCEAGDLVTLMAVKQSSEQLLQFLSSKELTFGSVLQIHFLELFDNSMIVSYGNKRDLVLSLEVCEMLLVRKESDENKRQ